MGVVVSIKLPATFEVVLPVQRFACKKNPEIFRKILFLPFDRAGPCVDREAHRLEERQGGRHLHSFSPERAMKELPS